jgi:uncharacterized NAD-dependent epimerase/dehydratase family protein
MSVKSMSDETLIADVASCVPPNVSLPQPYLLFLGDAVNPAIAKTAFGLRDWAPKLCLGEFTLDGCPLTLGLPRMTPKAAYDHGARALVVGVAAPGGAIVEAWVPALIEALHAGLDIISGMHTRLDDSPALKAAVELTGRRFIDVRRPPSNIPIASGVKRSGQRLLTVGTDCALGKKYSALAICRAMVDRGVNAQFRASGQTGIMIAGEGIAIDSVVCDFTAGAAEMLSPSNHPDHWDVIEGQGSLFHPAYAGVALGLLHGSQPDVIVMCHDPARTTVLGYPDYPLPSLEEAIALNLSLARRTNPNVRCGGISLNTSSLSPGQAAAVLAETAARTGFPVGDPVRGGNGFEQLVAACLT